MGVIQCFKLQLTEEMGCTVVTVRTRQIFTEHLGCAKNPEGHLYESEDEVICTYKEFGLPNT